MLRDRFGRPMTADMARFSSSNDVDAAMIAEDVDGSIAHVTMLAEVGLLTAEEGRALRQGLEQIRDEAARGGFTLGPEHEDVHMAVEARLIERLGEVGKKLHTARSRNDQVATDVRLWLKRRGAGLDSAITDLLGALLDRVEVDGRTLMPGYTHLQRGQPIWLGHHLLAHAWPLLRDRDRLRQALARQDQSPLGACAMAGTPHPIDRRRTAELLGFAGPVENAMDAVAARDHELELASVCSIVMIHLSRMAEELVLWSAAEWRFVRLGPGYVTTSSIMPQKANPDAAELVRGKAGRVVGDLMALLTLIKGLPMSYNRDLQEDRRSLFDALETTRDCVGILAGVWRTLSFDRERFTTELVGDFSLATELADYLVQQGVAFREAHEVVAKVVADCEAAGQTLAALTAENAGTYHAALARDLSELLDPVTAAERRGSLGGTAWVEVVRQVAILRNRL